MNDSMAVRGLLCLLACLSLLIVAELKHLHLDDLSRFKTIENGALSPTPITT